MDIKKQKFISAILIAIAVLGGFQALIYIVNLNQIKTFVWLVLAIYIYLFLKISLLYDLHFKNPGSLKRARTRHESVSHWANRTTKILLAAFWDRIRHFREWKFLSVWANYLLLPGFIFWATVGIFYINLGRFAIQQIFAFLSALAIIICYWFIKEIYTSKEEKIALNIFAALSSVKIYTALIVYGVILLFTRYYCLEPKYLFLAVFACTFLLIYQALFQHKFINIKNISRILLIAFLQGFIAYEVYLFWGYNYLTAAVFITSFYNLFWGIFHHSLEHTLYKRVFWEIVAVSLFIALLSVSATNFKAQILPGCF